MYKIFDAHTHTYPEILAYRAVQNLSNFYNFHVDCAGTVQDLMNNCRDVGASGFLLLGVATNARQVRHVNDAVAADLAAARSAGFRAYGFAAMHQDTTDFEDELNHAVASSLSGVKLHPDIQEADIDDKRFFPLYELLSQRGLPICLHMGDYRPQYRFSEPQKLAHVLELFPSLSVLAAHFGGYKSWDSAVECLRGKKNVVFDASSALWAMTPEYAKELIDKLGAENVLFGTDYPVIKTSDYLKLFFDIPLSEREREMILWDNAARFLSIEE